MEKVVGVHRLRPRLDLAERDLSLHDARLADGSLELPRVVAEAPLTATDQDVNLPVSREGDELVEEQLAELLRIPHAVGRVFAVDETIVQDRDELPQIILSFQRRRDSGSPRAGRPTCSTNFSGSSPCGSASTSRGHATRITIGTASSRRA